MRDFKVYVAEKPSLGKAIATVLAKHSPKKDSGREFIAGDDWAVVWAAGHIFEQNEPDYYLSTAYPGAIKSKNSGKIVWTYDHLPLLPGSGDFPGWAIQLTKDRASLFRTIKTYVSKATIVVNAGDPDREGQLLIDEILEEIKLKPSVPVRRVLISAIDEHSVQSAINNEKENTQFTGLKHAALGRSRADWLCGMNYTRAATLRAKELGYNGSVVSIGRVQTPLLGLIAQRDLDIEKFKPTDFYGLVATIAAQNGTFFARWKPAENQAGLDVEGRLIDRKIAQDLQTKIQGKQGSIINYSDENKTEGPWLPFSLDKLQVLSSKKYGYTPTQTLAAVQGLYETHKLCTYPRSDCSFLPTSQFSDAADVIRAVSASQGYDATVSGMVDPSLKSRAWNDSKVTAHHAIIPTTKVADLTSLTKAERDIYSEICRRFMAQFLPARKYRAVSVIVDVEKEIFTASGTTTTFVGWRAIYGAEADDESGEENAVLPPMKKGDQVQCKGLNIEAKKTTPPKHFTESTLLDAMVNIHKFVTDPAVKKMFEKMLADKKNGDEEAACGLGTPATRDSFVPKLIDVGLLTKEKPKKGKEDFIKSTAAGRALYLALPTEIGKPDMTALWEATLKRIEEGSATLEQFLAVQGNWITKTVNVFKSLDLKLPDPPGAKKADQKKFAPKQPAKASGKKCPKCGSDLMIRKSAKGEFLGCSGYPKCQHTENP